ncbi:MAG TPA: FAD:protein FMN transferase [Candidatus Dormibacteraeota bacterium]|nr:FAD:protein FMN transferase [Candidatus Dormibacteraeota bacterium]
MKQTWLIMGMPINVVIEDETADETAFREVRDYFHYVDDQYSPYKPTSEVSKINDGLPKSKWTPEMKTILELCQQTKDQTRGYFDVFRDGRLDPSGLVKGWAIDNAARLLKKRGLKNFYIEAGGDVQVSGHNADSQPWSIGVRNPFNKDEIVKAVEVTTEGVATSGTYIRGQHIYDPVGGTDEITDVASLTVIGPNIYDADRFATAAFAMGKSGISFIESLEGYEGYMISSDKLATLTGGFGQYVTGTAS